MLDDAIKRQYLPKAPAEMTREHLNNAIRFHYREKREAQERIDKLNRHIEGYAYALTELFAEHARREADRRTQHERNLDAAAQAAFDRTMRAAWPLRTYVDSSKFDAGNIVSLKARIALLETSNMALASKVEELSKRKPKSAAKKKK